MEKDLFGDDIPCCGDWNSNGVKYSLSVTVKEFASACNYSLKEAFAMTKDWKRVRKGTMGLCLHSMPTHFKKQIAGRRGWDVDEFMEVDEGWAKICTLCRDVGRPYSYVTDRTGITFEEMYNAYVTGDASLLDKAYRDTVNGSKEDTGG